MQAWARVRVRGDVERFADGVLVRQPIADGRKDVTCNGAVFAAVERRAKWQWTVTFIGLQVRKGGGWRRAFKMGNAADAWRLVSQAKAACERAVHGRAR